MNLSGRLRDLEFGARFGLRLVVTAGLSIKHHMRRTFRGTWRRRLVGAGRRSDLLSTRPPDLPYHDRTQQ